MIQRSTASNQRGDTLIEVTIALAILGVILVGSFAAANRAFNLGQSSKERAQLVNTAQSQAEALKSFRDSTPWDSFVATIKATGNPSCSAPAAGITPRRCFHMVLGTVGGIQQWVPSAGPLTTGTNEPATGNVMIVTATNDLTTPASYQFYVDYQAQARGGGPNNESVLPLELVNLDAVR